MFPAFGLIFTMSYQQILVNLGFLFLSDDSDEDDNVLVKFIFELGDPDLSNVFKLKDRGNCIFKEGNYLLAFSYYKQALKFLCLLEIPSTFEQQSCATSLSISLLLNLAACQLKLCHFREACYYYNLILNCDECNVKARYRRSLAFKNLNLFNEALEDFEAALKLEPNNKDISRELHSMVDCLAHKLNGNRASSQFDPLGMNRKGKQPFLNNDVVDNSVLHSEAAEASCSFVMFTNDASSYLGRDVNIPEVVMDFHNSDNACSPSSVKCVGNPSSTFSVSSNRVKLGNNSNDSNTSCPNEKQGDHLLNFSKKGGGHSQLRIDASSYNCLLQGKEIHVHQLNFLTTMKICVRNLPQKDTLMGTPHEEISREAVVPPSNPMYESRNEVSSFESSENDELVDEEVIVQIGKKKRLTLDSSSVTKISLGLFHFAAVREQHSSKICSCKMNRFLGRGQMARAAGKLRSKSLVVVEHCTFGCMYTETAAANKKTKRKDANLIQLDDFYHPPFKKRRLCPSISMISHVRWISGSFGGTSTPQFVW